MASAPRVIPYAPRRVFVPYHLRAQRWAVIVAHRRCGKTVSCVNDLIAGPRGGLSLSLPHGRYAYVAPYLAQGKEVAWEYLKRFAAPAMAEKNESELWVELINGARIRIHGADNPDRLRGAYLDGVVLDEYADMRPSVWGEIIRPMLTDRGGWATFIGTPKGRNAFHEVFRRAQESPDWYWSMLKASETGILPQAEIEAARIDMTPEQFDQEFECSFDAAILGAYFGKEIAEAERAGRLGDVPHNPDLPVHTAWDLGIGDSTAIWFWQASGTEIRIVDHYENHGQAIPHYAAVIHAKGYRRGDDWVPHDARFRSLNDGRTRIEAMLAHNLSPRVVSAHEVMDGVNAVRLVLPRCWFDRVRCADGLEALRQYRADFDEKTRAFKDRPRHDWTSHTADAFRYLAMAYRTEVAGPPKPERPKVDAIVGQPNGTMRSTLTFNQLVERQVRNRREEAA